jgi:hypothetical protein
MTNTDRCDINISGINEIRRFLYFKQKKIKFYRILFTYRWFNERRCH